MIRFSANVGFLFTEMPFLERFAAARRAGLNAVEFAWPRIDPDAVRAAIGDAGVHVAQMNMDAGDLAAGERGWASHPDAVGHWRDRFAAALELADTLDCPSINVLAGNALPGVSHDEMVSCLTANLRWAVAQARRSGRTLLLEVLNATDTPDYLFTSTSDAEAFVTGFDDPGLRLQFDTYHVASGGEEPGARFRELAPLVGHIQVADFPGRHEPGTGSIDFAGFLETVSQCEYGAFVGLEYTPSADTLSSLAWLTTVARQP